MAVEVLIKQKGLFKKNFKISDLNAICGNTLCYGGPNEAFVLKELETEESLEGRSIIVYDSEEIGRGFFVRIVNQHEIALELNLITTTKDIDNFYYFIKQICMMWKTDTFIEEDETIKITNLEEKKEALKRGNENAAKMMIKNLIKDQINATIFAAFNPITIPLAQAEEWNHLDGSEIIKAFSHYLNEKQSIDAFFITPFVVAKDDLIVVIYPIVVDGQLQHIIPKEPFIPYGIQLDNPELKKFDLSTVYIVFEDEEKESYEISFDEFMSKYPEEKLAPYDSKHLVMQTLSEVEFYNLYGDIVE